MNMNKEIRAEIRTLNQARKKIERDTKSVYKTEIHAMNRQLEISQKAVRRAKLASTRYLIRIDRRLAILNGRLS